MLTRAIFFDRDGTLIKDQHFLASPEQIELLPGAAEALREAQALGFKLVVVSNQSGVARGYFEEEAVRAANRRMVELLGLAPDAIYCCFHHPEGIRPEYAVDCDCRKPKPGMLRRAERELGVSLKDSVIIGDSLRDLAAGRAVGTRAVLVRSGEAEEFLKTFGPPIEADLVAANLAEAMVWVRGTLHRS